jgi:hypothetical protein
LQLVLEVASKFDDQFDFNVDDDYNPEMDPDAEKRAFL